MTKPYTWDEIKKILNKELKETKHMLTFGTIGSCNVEHDIDIIITKKPNSKSSDFYKEIHKIFDNLNNYLTKKYYAKLIRLPGLSFQGELLGLINVKKQDLIFHSLSQIKNQWRPWSSRDEDVISILKNDYLCLFGEKDDLFKEDFSEEKYYDFMFSFLAHYDRINFNYSDENLIKVMNRFYDYLFRKRLKLKTPVAKNEKQVREIFYKLCDILDDLNNKNP